MARKYAGITDPSDRQPLRGQVVVITGCTNGMGLSLTRALSKLGAIVIGIGRDPRRLQQVKREIPTMEPIMADLANLTSVARAANEIRERWERIHVLVNNAGIHHFMSNLSSVRVSAQGYDLVFAVNYLSHFLLTEMLSATLHNHTDSYPTLVQVSSTVHWAVDGSDLIIGSDEYKRNGKLDDQLPIAARPGGSTGGFLLMRSTRAYGNSKLAQLYHARSLKRKHPLWSSASGRAVSLCPSFVTTKVLGNPGSLGHTLLLAGYPSEGWGLASALLAILDTDPRHDYYSNSGVSDLVLETYRWMPPLFYRIGLRDFVFFFVGYLLLPFQKLGVRGQRRCDHPQSPITRREQMLCTIGVIGPYKNTCKNNHDCNKEWPTSVLCLLFSAKIHVIKSIRCGPRNCENHIEWSGWLPLYQYVIYYLIQ